VHGRGGGGRIGSPACGGLLWVDSCAEVLPAWWRFPRRALLWICGALLLDSALGF
jgi:hypothetical protein